MSSANQRCASFSSHSLIDTLHKGCVLLGIDYCGYGAILYEANGVSDAYYAGCNRRQEPQSNQGGCDVWLARGSG